MNYVFLDTNILLHCLPIEDIDFCKMLTVDKVQIIITHLVLQELDKNKYSGNTQRIKKKAKDSAKKIHDWFAADLEMIEIRPKVAISIYTEIPHKQNFDSLPQDCKLIEAILLFKESHSNDKVVFISNDTSACMMAKSRGIERIKISEEFLLPDEPDPLAKENQELKRQILEHENARPKISLSVNGQPENSIVLTLKSLSENPPITNSLENEILNFPVISKPVYDSSSIAAMARNYDKTFGNIPNSEYQRYEDDCQSYFTDYGKYLENIEIYKQIRFAELNITVTNIGNHPATNVDLYVHFPDGFIMFDSDGELRYPSPPKKPIKPRTSVQMALDRSNFRIPNMSQYIHSSTHSLKHTNSYEFSDYNTYIKHYNHWEAKSLIIVFYRKDILPCGFVADYKITVAELPKQITGKLNFRCVCDDKS